MPEDRNLRDPRRLYAPGRIYHIVERKFCRCGRFPPEVRTAIPVEGRFEHIVLSCHATSDHAILWIERESQKALERLIEDNVDTTLTTAPTVQRTERLVSLEREHKDALERAVSLNIPHAVASEEEPVTGREAVSLDVPDTPASEEEEPSVSIESGKEPTREAEPFQKGDGVVSHTKRNSSGNWDHLVQKLFTKNSAGKFQLKEDIKVFKNDRWLF